VASQLEPLRGRAAPLFFGSGLCAAGLTSAITAPRAAACAAGGALGWGSDLKSGRIRLLWGFVLLTGMSFGIFLGASPYQIILLAQAGNGIFLPLALILLLIVGCMMDIFSAILVVVPPGHRCKERQHFLETFLQRWWGFPPSAVACPLRKRGAADPIGGGARLDAGRSGGRALRAPSILERCSGSSDRPPNPPGRWTNALGNI